VEQRWSSVGLIGGIEVEALSIVNIDAWLRASCHLSTHLAIFRLLTFGAACGCVHSSFSRFRCTTVSLCEPGSRFFIDDFLNSVTAIAWCHTNLPTPWSATNFTLDSHAVATVTPSINLLCFNCPVHILRRNVWLRSLSRYIFRRRV
jgi:hypothetical protein